MKRRTRRKKLSRVRKTERQLLKALRSRQDVRGNIFEDPRVKRAMRKHNEALRLDERGMPLKHPFRRR